MGLREYGEERASMARRVTWHLTGVSRLSWKWVAIYLLVLFALSQVAFVLRSEFLNLQPIQVFTHRVAPGSPYVCFVAVQGGTEVLAMDCLDLSLTDPAGVEGLSGE